MSGDLNPEGKTVSGIVLIAGDVAEATEKETGPRTQIIGF